MYIFLVRWHEISPLTTVTMSNLVTVSTCKTTSHDLCTQVCYLQLWSKPLHWLLYYMSFHVRRTLHRWQSAILVSVLCFIPTMFPFTPCSLNQSQGPVEWKVGLLPRFSLRQYVWRLLVTHSRPIITCKWSFVSQLGVIITCKWSFVSQLGVIITCKWSFVSHLGVKTVLLMSIA